MATEADTTQFIQTTHKKEGDGQELSSEPLTSEFKGLPQEEMQKAEHRLKNPLEIFNLGEGETVHVPTNINVDPANAVHDGDVGTIEAEGFIRGSSVSRVACNEISSDYTKSEYIEQEIDRIVTEEKSEDQTKTSHQDGEDEKSTVSIISLGKEMDVDVNKQKNETTEDKEEKEKEEDAKENLSGPLVTAPIQEISAREVAQDEEGMLEDEVPGKTTAAFQEREPIESVEEIFNEEKKKATYHIDDMEKESSEENNLSQDGLKKKTEGVEDGTDEISVNDLYYTHPSVNEVGEKQDQDSRSEPQVSQANEESKETTMPMKNETENDKKCIESTGEKTFPENPQDLEIKEDSTTAQPKVEAENLSVENIENANILSSSRVADRNSEDNLNDKEMGIMDSEIGGNNSGSELKELIFDSAWTPEETRAETPKDENNNTTECDTGTSREIPFEETTNNLVELSPVPHVYEEIPVASVTKETDIWEVNREENVQSESFTIVSDKCESNDVNDIPKNIEATDLAENEKIHTQTADDEAADVEEEIVLQALTQIQDTCPKLNDEREVSTYGTFQDHMSKQKEPQTKEEQKETTMPTEKEIDNVKECIESTEEKTIQKTPQQVETREHDKSAQANEEAGNQSIDEIENENLPSSTVVNGNNEDDLNENEMGIMESEEEPKNSGSELMEQIVDTKSPPEETKVDTLKKEEDKDIQCATDLAENEKIQTQIAKYDGAAEVKEEIVLEAQSQNHDTSPKLNDERLFSTYRTIHDHMSKQKETQTKEEQKDTTMTTEKEIDNDKEYIESTEEKTIEKTLQQVETREDNKSAQANEEAGNHSIDRTEDENLPSSTVAEGKSEDNLNEKEMGIKESEEEPKNSDSELMEQIVDTTCPPEETKVDTLKDGEDKDTQCATDLAENEKIETQTSEDYGVAEVGEKIVLEAQSQNNDLSPKLNNEREFSTYGMLQDHMSKQKEPETKEEQKDTTMPTEKEIDNDKECIESTEEKTIQNTTQQVERREDNKSDQANEEAGNQSIDGIENENLPSSTVAFGKSEDGLNEKEMGIMESEEEPKNLGSKLMEQIVDTTCPPEETKVDTLKDVDNKDTQCATDLAENTKIQTQTAEDDGAADVGEKIVLEAHNQNNDLSPKLNAEREVSTYGMLQDHMSKQKEPETKGEQKDTTMPTEKEIDNDKECIESTEEKTIQNTTQQVETREDNKNAQANEEAGNQSIDGTENENLHSLTVAYGKREDNLNEKEMGIIESEKEPKNSGSELMEQIVDSTCSPEEKKVDTLKDEDTQCATDLAEIEKIQTQTTEDDGAAEVGEEIVLKAQSQNHDPSPKLSDEREFSTYGTLEDHMSKQMDPQTKEEQIETTMPTEKEIDSDKECIESTEEKTIQNTTQQVETREDDKSAQAIEEARKKSIDEIEIENLPSSTVAYGNNEDNLNEKEMGIMESEEEPNNSSSELMEQFIYTTCPREETIVDTLKDVEDKKTQSATTLAEDEKIQTQTTQYDGAAEVEEEIVVEAQNPNHDPSPKLNDKSEVSTYGTLQDHTSKQKEPQTKGEQNETTMPTEKEIDNDKECIESTEEKTIQKTPQQIETQEDDKKAQANEEAGNQSIDGTENENLHSLTVAYGKSKDNLNEKEMGTIESEEEPKNSGSELIEQIVDSTCPPEEKKVDTLKDEEDEDTQCATDLAEIEKIHTQTTEDDGAAEVGEEIVLEAQSQNHYPSPKLSDEREFSTYGTLEDHMSKQMDPQTKEEQNETTMPTEKEIDSDKECIESTEEKTIQNTTQQVETREDDKSAQAIEEARQKSIDEIEIENLPSSTVAYGNNEYNLNENEMGIMESEEEPNNSSSELMEQFIDTTCPPEETIVDNLNDEEDKNTQCATTLAENEIIQTQTAEYDGAAEVEEAIVLEAQNPNYDPSPKLNDEHEVSTYGTLQDRMLKQKEPQTKEDQNETTMPSEKEIDNDKECIESTEEKTTENTPQQVETREDDKNAQANEEAGNQSIYGIENENLSSLTVAYGKSEENLNEKEMRIIELEEEPKNSGSELMEQIVDSTRPPEETKVDTLKDEDKDTQCATDLAEIEKIQTQTTEDDGAAEVGEEIVLEAQSQNHDPSPKLSDEGEFSTYGTLEDHMSKQMDPQTKEEQNETTMPTEKEIDSDKECIESTEEKTIQNTTQQVETREEDKSAQAIEEARKTSIDEIEIENLPSSTVAYGNNEDNLNEKEMGIMESEEEPKNSSSELMEQIFDTTCPPEKTKVDTLKEGEDNDTQCASGTSKEIPYKKTTSILVENSLVSHVHEGQIGEELLHKIERPVTWVTEETGSSEVNPEHKIQSESFAIVSDKFESYGVNVIANNIEDTNMGENEKIHIQTAKNDGATEVGKEIVSEAHSENNVPSPKVNDEREVSTYGMLQDHVADQIVPQENEGCKETTMPTKKEINLDERIESTEEKTIQETPHEVETQEDNKSDQPNVEVELQTEEEMKSRNLPSSTFADINNEDNLNGNETRVIELKEEGNNSNPEHMEPIFDTICPPEEAKVKTLKDVEDNNTHYASGSSRELPYKETTKSYEACDRSPENEKAIIEETHSDKNFKNNLNEDIIVEKEVGQEDLGGLIQETKITGRKSISTINEEVPEATTDSPGMEMPDIQQIDNAERWIKEKTVQECFPEIEEIEVNNSAPTSDKEDENTEGTIEACYCSPTVAERVIEESLGGEEKDVTESKEEVMDSDRELLEENLAETQKDKVKSDRDCHAESTTNASKVPPAKETNQDLTENTSEKDVSEGILHKSEPTATGVTEEALKELNEENFWSDSSNLVSDSSLTRAEPYATTPNEHALLTAEASETTYDTTGKVGAFYVSPPSPLVSEQTKETTLQVQDMFMNPDVQADIPSSDMVKEGANEEVHDEDEQTYTLPALNVEGNITESENVDLLKISETSEVAECTNIEQLENSEDEKWLNNESKDKPIDPVNEACTTSTVNEKASQEQEHSIRNVKSSFNEEVETEKATIELDAEDNEQETAGSEKNCGVTLTTENLESIQAQPRAESTSVTGDKSDKANPLPDDVDFTAELREEDSVSGEDKNMEIPTVAKEEEHKSEEKTYLDVQKETCDTSLICEDEIEVSTSDTSLIHTAEQNLEDTPTLSSGEHNHVTIKPNDTTDEPQVQIESSSVNIYAPAAADIIEDKLFQKQVESMVPKDEAHLASIDTENNRPYEEIHGEDQEMYKMRVLSTEQNVTESEEIKPHKNTKATEIISDSDGAKWETLPVQKSLNEEVEEEAKKVVTSAFNEACDTSIEAEITIPEQIKDQDPMPTENPEVTNYSENEEAAKSKVIRDDFKEENREIYEKTGLQFEAINQSKETWIPIETTKNVTLNEEVPREVEKAKQSEDINRQTVEEQNCGAETGMKVTSNEKANKNHEVVELEPSEQVKCLTELEVEDHIIEKLRDTQIKEDIQYVKSMTLESSGEKIMEQDNQESETEMPGNVKSTSQSKKESEETQTWIESIKDVTWTEVVPKATDNTTESENIEEEMTKEENCILEHQKTLEMKKDPSTVATDNLEETVSFENPESVKTLAAEELELGSEASSIVNAPEEEIKKDTEKSTNNTNSVVAISVDAYEKENVEEAHLCNDKMHTAPVTLVTQNAASKEFLQEENSTRDLDTSLDDKTHEFKTTFPGLQGKEIENEKLQDKFGILSPVTDDGAIVDNESQNLQTLYTVDVQEPIISDTIYNSKERDVEDIHESRKETALNTTFEDKCEDQTNEVPETISEPHHQDVDTVIAGKVLHHTLTSGNITEQVQQQSCAMPSMEENHEIKPKSEKIDEGNEKKVEYLVQEISEEASKEEDVHSWTSKNEATNIPSHCSTVDGISTQEVDNNCEEAIPLKFWNNENALQTIYGEEAEELAEADTKEEKIATAITGPKVEENQSGIANEASEITTNEIKAEMVTEKDFVNETLVELPDKEPVISNYDEDVQEGIEYPGKRETEEPETNIDATPSVKLSEELESASLNEDDKKHIKGKDGGVEDSCRDKSTGVMTLSEEVTDQEFVMVKHNEGKESTMNREALMTDNNALGEKAPPKVEQEADEISVGIQETIQEHNVEKDEEYIDSTKRLTDDENPEHKTLESASGECHITDGANLKERGISLDDTRTLLPSRDLWNESTVKEEPGDIISDKQIAAEIIIPEEVKSKKYEQEHRNDEEEVDLTKSERTLELNEAKIDDIVHVDGEVETEDPSDKRNISSHKKVLSLETTQSDIRMDLVPDKDAQVFSHSNESKEFRISTGSKEIPEVQQKLNTQTFHNSENLKPENASAAEPEAKEGECLEETIAGEAHKETREEYSSTESAQNLLSAKRTSQVMELSIEEREPKESEKLQADKAESAKIEEAREDEEEGDEHKNLDSGSDAQVMVAAFNDVNEKAATHKKSHNILSGVGSKVKHSIAKVKKAITGKSSHPKPSSPK